MDKITSASENPKQASIIIRTYNEEEYLDQTLAMIFSQSYESFEIIIIDSGSTDNTLQIVRKYPVVLKEMPKETFTYGYALNLGAQLAQGEFVVFLSGHSVPCNTDWLTNLLEAFTNENVVGVCGKQVPHYGAQYSENIRVQKAFNKPEGLQSQNDLVFSNSNSAIRKQNWEICKFDELVEGGEDLIWAKIQIEQGRRIYFQPRAVVFHSHHFTWRRLANKATNDYLSSLRSHEPIILRRDKLPAISVYPLNALYALKVSLRHFVKIRRLSLFDFWDYWRTNFIYRTVRCRINRNLLTNPHFLDSDQSRFTYIK